MFWRKSFEFSLLSVGALSPLLARVGQGIRLKVSSNKNTKIDILTFPYMVITNRGCQLMHLVPSFHFHWVVMGGLLHSLQAPEGVVGPGE